MTGSEVASATSRTCLLMSSSEGPRKKGGRSMSAPAPASSARLACFTATSWLWAVTETIAVWGPGIEGGFDQGLSVSIGELVELARKPEHCETRKPAGLQVPDEADDAIRIYLAVGEERRGQDRVAAAQFHGQLRSFTAGSPSHPDA